MGLLSLLGTNPALFFALAGLLLYSAIFHEVAHGWVARLFGDDTAERHGRLTLNPASHVDPIGTLMLFLVGFGWARPVPVDYRRLRNGRAGIVMVALAGPAANIFIATFAAALLQIPDLAANPLSADLLAILVRINIILGAFNLIPIPPLDGSKVLMGFLPEDTRRGLARFERYGFFMLIFLMASGRLNPVTSFMQKMIYGFIRSVLGTSG
jgi:Zn-dependent protease